MQEINFLMPSGGHFPDSLAEMTLKEMTVREEKALFTSKQPFVKMQQLLTNTFVSGLDKEGNEVGRINLSSWPLVDMTHALLKLRSVTIGKDYDFTVQCPICDRAVSYGVDLEDGLDVKFAEPGIEPVYSVKLSFGVIKLKHLLVKDQHVIDRLVRQKKSREGRNFDGGYTIRLASQIVAVDDNEFASPVTAEVWLEGRTSREREEISVALDTHSFGDDLSIAIDCPYCNAVEDAVMPITRDFLFRRKHRRG